MICFKEYSGLISKVARVPSLNGKEMLPSITRPASNPQDRTVSALHIRLSGQHVFLVQRMVWSISRIAYVILKFPAKHLKQNRRSFKEITRNTNPRCRSFHFDLLVLPRLQLLCSDSRRISREFSTRLPLFRLQLITFRDLVTCWILESLMVFVQ